MTLFRLYRLRRRAGLSRRLSLRLAFESLQRDRAFEHERRRIRVATVPRNRTSSRSRISLSYCAFSTS